MYLIEELWSCSMTFVLPMLPLSANGYTLVGIRGRGPVQGPSLLLYGQPLANRWRGNRSIKDGATDGVPELAPTVLAPSMGGRPEPCTIAGLTLLGTAAMEAVSTGPSEQL
jgi:hypothetical protein